MSSRLARVLLAVLAAATVSAACGSSGHSASPGSPSHTTVTTGAGNTVAIRGFAFAPATLTVKVGTTVTWTQDDPTVHTVTDAGAFDSGTLAQGRTYSKTFTKLGTYSYICSIHTYMKGTVTVVS